MKDIKTYIKLTGLTDRNGQQCRVIVNTKRVLGIEERYGEKFGGGVQKDKSGYPKVFSEIFSKGKSFFVLESIEEIYDKIYGYDLVKRIALEEGKAKESEVASNSMNTMQVMPLLSRASE